MRKTTFFMALLAAAGSTGCSEQPSALLEVDGPAFAVSSEAVKFWNTLASVQWNERATTLAAAQPVDVGRMYAYLSFAQYRAAVAAAAGNDPHPPISAAIGAASAAVLESFFSADMARIEAALDTQQAAARWPGEKHTDFDAGAAIGRSVGAQVMAWAATDGVGLTAPGTPPVGPGYWFATNGVMARGNLGARPFFMDVADEFRSPAPPAFGSPTFLAALAEVRQISDTRTAAQLAIAQYWNLNQSPRSNAAMNEIARDLIVRYRRSDAEAARILFLANAASFDAIIGCFEAKYHYWLLRPSMADAAITLPIGLPPHPSYPSAHSCVSGAITGVLMAAFPSERAFLEGRAEEASLSRLYAGIHYRFDMTAGLALGAQVADKAWHADLDALDITP